MTERIDPPPSLKVTVLVTTYNHERFIRQALESVLTQRTTFAYDVLITEDCSTDQTRSIVIDYQQRYPDRIRLLLSERNLRSNAVVARGLRAARGDYIALLDGDDYWICADKLQRQAEFLDRHPECALCFHNCRVVHQDGSASPWNWTPADHPTISTFKDIWMGNFITSCSTMFRRATLGEVPYWYEAMFLTDWPLHILNARHGDIGYIDEVMSVYRYHAGGQYSTYSEWQKLEQTFAFYQTMNANLGYRYNALVKTALARYFFEWAEEYAARRDRTRAWRCLARYLRGRPINEYISIGRVLRLCSRLCLPWAPRSA